MTLPAYAETDATPVGRWHSIHEKSGKVRAVIEVRAENDSYVAVIKKLFTAPDEPRNPTCIHCADDRRDKPIEGMIIVRGLKRQSARTWTGGEILNPEDGKTYDCITELSEDGNELRVRAYRALPILGRTQVWRKVK